MANKDWKVMYLNAFACVCVYAGAVGEERNKLGAQTSLKGRVGLMP